MGLGLYPKVKAIPVDIYSHICILYTWLDAKKTERKRIEEDRTVEAMRGNDRRERSKGSEDDSLRNLQVNGTRPAQCGQVPQRGGDDNL